jgi:tetratricopeptide (TPR) repeat protein
MWIIIFLINNFSPTSLVFAKDKDVIKQSSQYITAGKERFKSKDYYGAVEIWTEVLKVDPWNEEVKALIETALKKIEELTEKLDEGFELLEADRVDEAYTVFLYVKENSNPENKDLYEHVARGFNTIERIRNREKYTKLIEEADGLLESGKYEDALDLYSYAYKFNPESELATKKLIEAEKTKKILELKKSAIQYFESEEYVKSTALWNDVLEIDPYDKDAPIYLSKIDFKIRESERLQALARSYFDNGVSLYRNKKYEEAIDQFENAIAMNYRTEESKTYIERIKKEIVRQEELEREKMTEEVAWYLREGIKYYNLNQYKRSLTSLNRGLELDSENTQIKEYIIRDIIALKREEEKAVPVTSPFYKLIQDLKRLGTESYIGNNYQESIKYWEEILLIFPFNEVARLNLTKALSKTDPALARDILNNMYDEAKDLVKKNKKREALAKLKLILEVDPGNKEARNLLQKLESEKKKEIKVVSAEDKKKAQELYDRGVEFYQDEKLEEAVRVWKQAVDINPEFVEARVFLSRAETKLRNLERLASSSDQISDEVQGELRIKIKKHYLDGLNYYMNGMYVEAITEWEEVLKIDPDYENVKGNIERAKKRLGYEAG